MKIFNYKFLLSIFVLFIVNPALGSSSHASKDYNSGNNVRNFELTYQVEVNDLPKYKKHVNVWVPLPQGSSYQTITDIKIKSPVSYEINFDAQWGNRMVFFEVPKGIKSFIYEMVLTVETSEDTHDIDRVSKRENGKVDAILFEKFLDPTRLAIQNERVKRYARIAAGEEKTIIGKARSIYDFVLKNMDYSKSSSGVGSGDVDRVCISIMGGEHGEGNCTDYHSLFGSLMRMEGIPVKFNMGFPLKSGHNEEKGIEGGYHCWAEFYVPGFGWLPVDISEADKDPSKKDYYFGSLDENRILFSVGRDITLVPAQKGESLNFFGPGPYIEVDGKPFLGFTRTIKYKDID